MSLVNQLTKLCFEHPKHPVDRVLLDAGRLQAPTLKTTG
jgi:hypothetical protein